MIRNDDPAVALKRQEMEQNFKRDITERQAELQLKIAEINATHQAPRQMWQNILLAPWEAWTTRRAIQAVQEIALADKHIPPALTKLIESY